MVTGMGQFIQWMAKIIQRARFNNKLEQINQEMVKINQDINVGDRYRSLEEDQISS